MSDLEKMLALIEKTGGEQNVINVTNCMTRVRIAVKDDALINDDALKNIDGVLGIVHDKCGYVEIVVGPGKCKKYADAYNEHKGTGLQKDLGTLSLDNDWKTNKAKQKSGQKSSRLKDSLKTIGEIFVPLLPGIIAAGICAGLSSLISGCITDYNKIFGWALIFNFLKIINQCLLAYLSAWAGYRAAEKFGATPVLGGMLGMITILGGIDDISKLLGWYDNNVALNSILRSGRGGVLAALLGVWLLAKVETAVRKRIPENLDIIFTPLLSLFFVVFPYVLLIMPLTGLLSSWICDGISMLCMSEHVVVRILAGFISTALFLPMVAMGMHHGLVALYSVQLQTFGYVTLYPALAMAGAGQVGAAIAIYVIAKRVGNFKLCQVIKGALPAGFLGIGEPLIYGVTLPLGRPFVSAGIGAGFGGAFVMIFQVAATVWGPSGLLGFPVMTAGPNGAVKGMVFYGIGLLISYIGGYVLTKLFVDESMIILKEEQTPVLQTKSEKALLPAGRRIKHGEPVSLNKEIKPFRYIIKDPVGMHARPAGELAELARQFSSKIIIQANGRETSASSMIGLMKLGIVKGTEITVSANGSDTEKALEAISRFLESRM